MTNVINGQFVTPQQIAVQLAANQYFVNAVYPPLVAPVAAALGASLTILNGSLTLGLGQLTAGLAQLATGLGSLPTGGTITAGGALQFSLSNGASLAIAGQIVPSLAFAPAVTLPAGTPATVTVLQNGASYSITLGLTKGDLGPAGPAGTNAIQIAGTASLYWNAATNTPALTNGGGGEPSGTVLVVSTPGTTTLDGNSTWNAGDLAYNPTGTLWIRIPNTVAAAVVASLSLPGATIQDDGTNTGTLAIVDQYGNVGFSFSSAGFVAGAINASSLTSSNGITVTNGLTVDSATVGGNALILDDGTGTPGLQIIDPYNNVAFAVSPSGAVSLASLNSTASTVTALTATSATIGSNLQVLDDGTGVPGLVILDAYQNIALQVSSTGSVNFVGNNSSQNSNTGSFSADDFLSHNTENLSHSYAVRSRQNTTAQRPVFKYTLGQHYGQSKSVGEQGGPALSTTAKYSSEVFMLGLSPRPVGLKSSASNVQSYTTFGDTAFHPLAATNQDGSTSTFVTPRTGAIVVASGVTVTTTGSGGSVVGTYAWTGSPDATTVFSVGDTFQASGFVVATGNNPAANLGGGNVGTLTAVAAGQLITTGISAQATVSPESNITFAQTTFAYFGEDASVGFLNELRSLQLDYWQLAQDTTRTWVSTNSGVSGQDIAALTKNANPNLYNRLVDSATKFKATAQGLGGSYGIGFVLFDHGGTDEQEGTASAAYKAGYQALINNHQADVVTGVLGQIRPPFWLGSVVDGGAMNTGIIAQAQMELFGCSPVTGFSTPYTPNMFLIGGCGQMPDHSNHLSQNGYRWRASQYAKVKNKLLKGEGWLPLHIIGLWVRGSTILIDYHVPEPPIQIKPAFVIQRLVTFSDWGFTASDSSGALVFTPALASDTSIALTCTRAVASGLLLSYADLSHTGTGNVCDSDPSVALSNWLFTAGSGQLLTENFPGPITSSQIVSNNQPYPLWNYACPATNLPGTAI